MNRQALLFAATGVAILAGLWLWLRPAPQPPAPQPAVASPVIADAAPMSAATPEPLAPEWVVQNGQRVSGPDTVRARQGDTLLLTVTVDHDDELHVHGYDRQLQLKAGQPGTLTLALEHAGRFDMELHHAHVDLAAIEVMPD